MSETPKQEGESDRDLERQMAELTPLVLDPVFANELLRDCKRITADKQEERKTHVHWKRLIPLSLAACLLMVGYLSYQFDAIDGTASVSVAEPPAMETVTPAVDTGIVPVSSEGFLIRTSSGGIIESENGPVEELSLEFQDSYHWRDPATNTNIRFFTPRNERVLVPVITN